MTITAKGEGQLPGAPSHIPNLLNPTQALTGDRMCPRSPRESGAKTESEPRCPLPVRVGLTPLDNLKRPSEVNQGDRGTKLGSQGWAFSRGKQTARQQNPQSEVYSRQSFPPPSPAQDRDRQLG